MKSRVVLFFLCLALSGCILAGVAEAQTVPQLISYQGRLTTAAGQPLDSDTVQMHFALLDGETAGSSVLWGETHSAVKVSQGLYNVILGSVNPIPDSAVSGAAVYLEVKARGELLSPRQRMTSVAFALKAKEAANAAALGGTPSGNYYSGSPQESVGAL